MSLPGAILAALGGGATQLGNDLATRELLAEQRKKASADEALRRLVTLQGIGGTELPDNVDPSQMLQRTVDQANMTAGVGSAIPNSALGLPDQDPFPFGKPNVVQLPGPDGKMRNVMIDPSRSPNAMLQRRQEAVIQAQQTAELQRQQKLAADQRALEQAQANAESQAAWEALRLRSPKNALGIAPHDPNKRALYVKANAMLDQIEESKAAAENRAPVQANWQSSPYVNEKGEPLMIEAHSGQTRPVVGGSNRQSVSPQRALVLQQHFNSDQTVKDSEQVATALQKIRQSSKDPSAAGDLSMLYGYMKLLDPNSVVRESEFATAAKSGSLPQQVQAYATRIINGQRLTPEQRQDFVNRAEAVAKAQSSQFRTVYKRYSDQATRNGVDPLDVVYDPFDGLIGESPAQGGTREQQLWDAAVAKHGREKVLKEFGPRPGGEK